MSTLVELFPEAINEEFPPVAEETEPSLAPAKSLDGSDLFAEQQMRNLVQQVFLNPQKPCRQIVFSSVDAQTDLGWLCRTIGETLASELNRATCVVEASRLTGSSDIQASSGQRRFGTWRDSAEQLSRNLWLLPAEIFVEGNRKNLSPAVLRGRLAELRLDFDFTVIQAPPCTCSEGTLLAASCDGLVLLIEANKTRRAAAKQVKQFLTAANITLLGTVLTERTFPIPEAIYRRI